MGDMKDIWDCYSDVIVASIIALSVALLIGKCLQDPEFLYLIISKIL